MLMVASTLHCEIAVVKLQASARQSAGGYSLRAAVAQEPLSSLANGSYWQIITNSASTDPIPDIALAKKIAKFTATRVLYIY